VRNSDAVTVPPSPSSSPSKVAPIATPKLIDNCCPTLETLVPRLIMSGGMSA